MNSNYSRRHFLGFLGGAALVAAVPLTAARSGIGPVAASSFNPGTPEPVDPDERVLLRIHLEGGFVPAEFLLTNIPMFSLYGDGRVITTGPMIEIFPQPALPNLRDLKLNAAGIERVLTEAQAAGLTDGSKHYDINTIADASTTVFTYDDGTNSTVVSAYALGLDEQHVANPGEMSARKKLVELQSFLLDLSTQLAQEEIEAPDQPYEIDQIRIYSRVYDAPNQDPDLVQEPMAWPLSTPLSKFGEPISSGPLAESTRCGAIEGEDAKAIVAALTKANQLTPWESEGSTYQLWARPLLPDESGCPESQ